MTKIEWADMTWNPVWGCLNKCEYCYARKIARRFKDVVYRENKGTVPDLYYKLDNFTPVWIESNFRKDFPAKVHKRIFVNSMSDIYYWKSNWMRKVLKKIKQYPQHQFQFLTKFPKVYNEYKFPNNCSLGITLTGTESDEQLCRALHVLESKYSNFTFISLEPIQTVLSFKYNSLIHPGTIDWLIVGAETGNRKGKVVPEREWIENIRTGCNIWNIPLFEKDSIGKIIDRKLFREFIPNEFVRPWRD